MSGSASDQGKGTGKGGVNYTGLPYPPFTTLTTSYELIEWALRVEVCFKAIDNRIVANFNRAPNTKEVEDDEDIRDDLDVNFQNHYQMVINNQQMPRR